MRRASSALGCLLVIFLLAGCAKRKRAARSPSVPSPGWSQTGTASWYGNPYHGRQAANGEIYDMEKLTAAHRTLPFGALLRVTNLSNSSSVDVRINDRGPFVDGRIIDLSRAAAIEIGMIGPGTARVRVELLGYGAARPPASGRFAVQVGAFTERENAERLRERLDRKYSPVELIQREGSRTPWHVLVGRRANEEDAAELASRLRRELGDAFVVRLDSPQ